MLCYILLWLATDLFNYILKRFFNDEIVLWKLFFLASDNIFLFNM